MSGFPTVETTPLDREAALVRLVGPRWRESISGKEWQQWVVGELPFRAVETIHEADLAEQLAVHRERSSGALLKRRFAALEVAAARQRVLEITTKGGER